MQFRGSSRWLVVPVMALALPLAACQDYGTKEGIGTLAGAGLGAWAGSAIDSSGSGGVVAIAAGTLIGGFLGNQIGRGLDKADRLEAERAQYQALEYGRSGTRTEWRNPDSGHSGWVEPAPAYQSDRGQTCREYTHTVIIGGKPEQAVGTACRQEDGSWRVAS